VRILLVLLLLGGVGYGVWHQVVREEPCEEGEDCEPVGPRTPVDEPGRPGTREIAAAPWVGVHVPGEQIPSGEDSDWSTRPLPIVREGHKLTGAAVLDALEKARVVRVRADSEADLEALRKFEMEGIGPPPEQPMTIMDLMPFFASAGFQPDLRPPVLSLKRTTPPDVPR
jgi:hypothetical protein